jgi:glycosyltransferase involved in cell wall biosynthesis
MKPMGNLSSMRIWFWQRIITPHMAHLAVALAPLGCNVTYVAEREMTTDRAGQGWKAPGLPGVDLYYANSSAATRLLVRNAPANSVHICQGIRANGLVAVAQRALTARGLREWIMMETVDDSGLRGSVKRFEYGRLFGVRCNTLQGVLATGYRTADWVAARGMPADRVYPFAYFLPDTLAPMADGKRKPGPFRFVFAGQLIPRKRVDWLINALAYLMDHAFELWIVGAGTEESMLHKLALRKLGDRVRWLGVLPLSKVPVVMAQADCLVLPSVHDGWGAVVSEALMVGTPVICSDACGSAGVVQASKFGGVFTRDRGDELRVRLDEQLRSGPVDMADRRRLASWATALGAEAGARYLINILDYAANGGSRPMPPWQNQDT